MKPFALILPACLAVFAFGGTEPPGERIREAAEEALRERFPDAAPYLEVRVVRTDEGADTLEAPGVHFPSLRALPSGHTQIGLTTKEGVSAGWAMLYVARFDTVAVARQSVRAGDTVAGEVIGPARIETTRFPGEPLRWRDLPDGPLVADRNLAAGQALRIGDVRPPDLVHTGEAVMMRYTRNGLDVRIPGAARERGGKGTLIRIFSSTTRATYRARITGPGEAEWVATL